MRIKSSLSSASVDNRTDSPKFSPSPVSMRASECMDDNIPLIRRPVPRRDGSGLLRRSVCTMLVAEKGFQTYSCASTCPRRIPVPQLVDEDVVDLE